jgi:uncharacterized protein (TIGR00156 family)
MRKRAILLLAATSTTAFANQNVPQQNIPQQNAYQQVIPQQNIYQQGISHQCGFVGPNAPAVNSVQVARDARDDSHVILTGHIVAALGDEDYMFRDYTGEIVVEIDHRDWGGVATTPYTLVTIHGEVDRDWTQTTVDVYSIKLAR